MTTHAPKRPTNAELEILQVLWKLGPSTVRAVNDYLNQEKEVGYTTTLKLMQIMYEKGLLSRRKSGRTHIYRPLASEEETRQDLLDRMVDTVFGGSALKLVMQALGRNSASREELEEIRQYLDELSTEEGKKKGGPK